MASRVKTYVPVLERRAVGLGGRVKPDHGEWSGGIDKNMLVASLKVVVSGVNRVLKRA
jgi:hypothetical protein